MSQFGIFKLEDRVLFDAAGAAEAVEAVTNADNHSQVSESQVQDNEAKDALKNAPPENPADAAVQQQMQQTTPENVADLDAAADAIVDGEIVPGANPVDTDAADADDAGDHAAPDTVADVDAADADGDDISADDDGGDIQAADADDGINAVQHSDLGDDIDDFINLDADTDADTEADDAVAFDGGMAAADADAPQRDLVIINSSVQNKEQIVDALGENTDVLYLEAGTDPLDAINDFLDANGDVKYSAIHIVSHGNAGYFVLNGQIIDADAVMSDPASWANIGQHMTADGDIMIYGCNVAGSLDGEMLISNIANLTGADVAASVDDTGVHGDWDLEYTVGTIDNPFLDASDYEYTLDSYTVSLENGTAADEGSLAWALEQAQGGGDIVLTVDAVVEGDFSLSGQLTLSSDGGTYSATISSGAWNFSGSTSGMGLGENTTLVVSSEASFNGNLRVQAGSTLNVAGKVSNSILMNMGTIELSSTNADFTTATLSNYGVVNAAGGQWGEITNTVNGRFNITDAGISWTNFQNQGTLNINTDYSGIANLTNEGNIVVASGVTWTLPDTVAIGGTVTVSADGELDISAAGSASDNTTHTDGVELTNLVNNGTVSVSTGALLAITDGLTNNSQINIEEATFTLADTVSSPVGGTVYVRGSSFYHAETLSFSDLDRWYKVDSDSTLSDYITANGLDSNEDLQFYLTDGAVFTLDATCDNSIYSYQILNGEMIVQVASIVGSLESDGTITTSANLDITGATSGTGTLNADAGATVVYRQSGTVFGGTYNGDLNLVGYNMTINGDVEVKGVFIAPYVLTITDTGKLAFDTHGTDVELVQVINNGEITVTDSSGLDTGLVDITFVTSGTGTMTSDVDVIYRQSGVVFGGTYHDDLSLTGSSMTITGDVIAEGVFSAKTTTGSVSVTINSGSSLTIQGVVADALTTSYQINGTMNIATQAAKVAVAGVMYVGGSGALNLSGDYVSLNGYVAIQAGSGTVTVTGAYTEFTAGFSDTSGWYNYTGYITDKTAAGLHESVYQVTRSISMYNGSMTIDTSGEVVFSGSHEIVIANELNIEQAAKVTFNATLVMAAGTFTASGNVTELYFNDVYVSTQYRTSRSTGFNIAAKDTVFGGSLNLYAVSPRNYTNDGTNEDGSFKWNRYTDYETGVNSSGGNIVIISRPTGFESALAHFTGERVTFNDSVNLSAGYGEITFTNEAGAMTFNGNITNDASGLQPGDGGSAAFTASLSPETVGYMTDYSKFFMGDNTTVNGSVTNTASNISAYALQTPFAYFSIGSNNNFSASSSFVNSGSYLFVAVEVQGGGNNFSSTFTNSASLSVNPGPDAARNVFENLINRGTGEVTFAQSGNASVNIDNQAKLTVTDTSDGIQFTGLSNSGTASILGDVKFLAADFGSGVVENSGTLTINGTLESELSLSNRSGATFIIAGPDSKISGDITNAGTFSFRSNAEVTGVVNNSGTLNVDAGAAGMVFASLINAANSTVQLNAQATLSEVTNSGSLTVNTTAANTVIGALDNKTGAKLIASGAVIFGLGGGAGGVENAGTVTISNSVTCIDGARLVNYAGGYLYLNQTLPLDDHRNVLNLSNAGTVEISGTVHLGEVTNSAGSVIRLTTAASIICFDGKLMNDGGITGTGSVVFRGSMEGNGYLTLAGANSSVTYDAASDEVTQIFYATDANGNYVYNADVVILGGEVHIDRDITFNRGFSLGQQDSSGAVEGDGTLVVDSGYTFNASTVDLYSGTLQIQNGATFQSSNDLVFSSAITLENDGVIQLLEGKSVTFEGETAGTGSLAMSGGDITYSGTMDQYLYATSGTFGAMTLENGMKYIGFDLTLSELTNLGANMTVQSGAMLTLGRVTGSSDYTINVEQGAVLKAGGEATALGAISNSGQVLLDVAEGIAVSTGAISNNAGGVFDITSAGTLTVDGAVTNAGTMNVAGTGAGSITFSDTVENSGALKLASGAVTVGGLLTNTNTGTVNAYAGILNGVSNSGTFNVEADEVVFGAFTNTGALNFNSDFQIVDATFGSPAGTVELGGVVSIGANANVTVSMGQQLRFSGLVSVAEGAAFRVYSVGEYDKDAVALLSRGVYVANLQNAGEVVVRGLSTVSEAVLEINNVELNSGRISSLANGVLLLSQSEADVPGEIYVQDGQVYYAGRVPGLSVWLTVTDSKTLSYYASLSEYSELYNGNYGFLIKDGGTLTVDTVEAGSSILKYNVEAGGALIFAVAGNVAGSVNVAEGGSIDVNSGATVTFFGVTSGNGTMNAAGSVVYDNTGAGFGGTYGAGLTVNGSNITFADDVMASELAVSGSGVTFSGDVTSNSTVAVTGDNVAFGGALTAEDGMELNGDNAAVNGALSAGSLNIGGDGVSITGAVTSGSTVAVSGDNATFGSALTAAGAVELNGDNAAVNGALSAGSLAIDGRDVSIAGAVTSDSTVAVSGNNATVGGDLTASGAVELNGDNATVSGALTAGSLTIGGSDVSITGSVTSDSTVAVSGNDMTIGGALTAAGAVELSGDNAAVQGVLSAGSLNVAGNNAAFSNSVTAGDTSVSGSAVFGGAASFADLAVDGSAVFNSSMNASGSVGGSGSITFNGTATAGSMAMGTGSTVTYNAGSEQVIDGTYDSLTLNGAHTMNNAVVNGTATINGGVTSSGTLNFGANGNVVAGAAGAINSTGLVVYAGSGDVVSGSYNQLAISGNDQTAGDVTVNGSLVYTGSNLNMNGTFTNNGSVTLNGNPAYFNGSVVNNGAFDVAGNGNQFSGDFVNNKVLEVSGEDNVFFRVTNNGDFTLNGDHNFFSAVSNLRNFAITGDANRIVSFTNTSITNIDGEDNSFGSINNTGNGVIYKNGQMWMVSGVGGVGDGFPDEFNLNFSSLALLLGNQLRSAELEALFLAGDDSPFVYRRRVSRIPDGIDDLGLALETEFDELQMDVLDDLAAFDAADFQDGDYADVMDSADAFTDTVDEALAEMAAV